MCYSGMVESDLRKYLRRFALIVDYQEFARLLEARAQNDRIKLPRAVEQSLLDLYPGSRVAELIAEFRARKGQQHEEELFRQKRRLADAQRKLAAKPTKAAQQEQRIATDKIAWLRQKLAELRGAELTDEDSRIFPLWYAPVVVAQGEKWAVRPMRYQCRPAGKPANYDQRYPGCYNARRDNLEGFWREQFGASHAFVWLNGFYENVARHDFERRALGEGEKPENLILNFRPRGGAPMFAAALWSAWQGEGEALNSFAIVTDEPPEEVAAAGHDRCPIPLKEENLKAWLAPSAPSASFALFDDRERPYYEHRLAA